MTLLLGMKRAAVSIIFWLGILQAGIAQKSIVELFKSDRALADSYFRKGEFQNAIKLYERASKSGDTYLMLARAYFQLKEYRKCLDAYERFSRSGEKIEKKDYLNSAEANMVLKNYEEARANYQKVLESEKLNDWVQKKIWRISNMNYLYEDSIHFATRLLSINTTDAEWGCVPFEDGILFISNRPSVKPMKRIDATTLQSFYEIYHAREKPDTLMDGWSKLYVKPNLYKANHIAGNAATFSLYSSNSKMVFAASSASKDINGMQLLGLYFAELQQGKWTLSIEFVHNNMAWSTTDPSIDEKGKTLYFSSDRPGGYGGKDLYRSEWINNHWTAPTNLGEAINTPMDEVFPHLQNGTLYFSSNGHTGMGGLDIYKIEMNKSASDEPVNLGYPMNSTYDDFAITFTDAKSTHGFLSSNRKRGGMDDDLYEFDMDLQTYPFTITGVIKQMDHSWSDSSAMRVLRKARILLVDNIRNVTVESTKSDSEGAFSLSIPYFSKYAIHVVDPDGIENVAVFEIPRQRKKSTIHEIVMIKDIFQTISK